MGKFSYFLISVICVATYSELSFGCPAFQKLATRDHPTLDRAALEYQSTGTQSSQNIMYGLMWSYIERTAKKLANRLPPNIEIADLETEGFRGMLDAATNFDVTKGAVFATYSQPRILGAMLDFIRDTSEIPRVTLTRKKFLNRCLERYRTTYGRNPSPEELREAVTQAVEAKRQAALKKGKLPANFESIHSIDKILDTLTVKNNSSLDRSIDRPEFEKSKDDLVIDTLSSEREGNPRDTTEALSLFKWLERKLIDPVDRDIFRLYFGRALNYREAGAILDLTESRISQRVKLIRERLVQAIWREFPDVASRLNSQASVVSRNILLGGGLEDLEFELETTPE
ncbi:MAG: hypothetical protein COV44_00365 [Deltaproteobacteria bacterium CG11_big_fil_rev_8_21_14_0_20_45_16]|nr:MAG: hypothetical protein COV44_00365 [Deltaproteobacteria bacterium CG11_big_fil_rev_8_21_14_0_20_45_16]